MAYAEAHRRRLHIPLHGGLAPDGARALSGVYSIDLTEVPGLDDWARPDGILAAAEELAAKVYGVKRARFITTGSSTALTIAIASAVGPGDLVVAHRGVHRSILHGLLVTRALPHLVPDTWSVPFGVNWPDLAAMAKEVRERRPKAVIVTCPTFTGLAPGLGILVEAAHGVGAMVIVDAAHGAHFGHPGLPPLAASEGADLVVFGMHKSGGALTAGSLLGLGEGADAERVDVFCRALATSSPSYPIMASIDIAVRGWASGEASKRLEASVRAMSELTGQARFVPPSGLAADPSRAVINPLPSAVFEAHGIVPEYVSSGHALLLAPLGMPPLPDGFLRSVSRAGPGPSVAPPPVSRPSMPPWEALDPHRRRRWVPLTRATGGVSADLLSPSPPGIPWVWPGEVIEAEIVDSLLAVAPPQRVLGMNDAGEVCVVA